MSRDEGFSSCDSAPERLDARAVKSLATVGGATAGILFWSGRVTADVLPTVADKTLPCRPTIACTADMVPEGTLELETGALLRRGPSHERQWSFPFLLKLTAIPHVQVQLGGNGPTFARGPLPAEYFDDFVAGAKVHLYDQTALMPSLSLSAAASLPTFTGQKGYLRTVDVFFTGYVTKDIGAVHADWNFGANLWRVEGSPLEQVFTALALSGNLPPPFGIMAEVYGFTDALPVASRDGGVLFALSVSPRSWLMFDMGGDVGFFPSARRYSVFLGATFIPAVLWRPASATEPLPLQR